MTSVKPIRYEIFRLIQKYEPNNVSNLDDLMKKYKYKENELLKHLCIKYKTKYKHIKLKHINKVYLMDKVIGSGASCVVKSCKRKKDNKKYAIKIINKNELDNDDIIVLESEVKIIRLLSHKNIVKLHDVYESKTHLYLILDLCRGGTLFDRIIEFGHFSEKLSKKIFKQMLLALQYLHKRFIVHRDLKV